MFGASAVALWLIGSSSLRTLSPEAGRLLAYAGVLSFAVGWLLVVSTCLGGRSPLRSIGALGLYLTFGSLWITVFYVWLGIRPTSLALSPNLWAEALVWPLLVAQAVFGLRYA